MRCPRRSTIARAVWTQGVTKRCVCVCVCPSLLLYIFPLSFSLGVCVSLSVLCRHALLPPLDNCAGGVDSGSDEEVCVARARARVCASRVHRSRTVCVCGARVCVSV